MEDKEKRDIESNPLTVGEFKHFLNAIPDDLELVICFSHKRQPDGFFDYRRPVYQDMMICPDMLLIDVAKDKTND